MDYMDFLTILAWIFGVLASLITLYRMYRCANIGLKSARLNERQQRALTKQHGFLVPLVIAIVCWAFIIAV
jgi:Na+/H+ antiporter NhaD/arsenite permease-like protein